MKIPDKVLGHLREVTAGPDLSGTCYRLVEPLGSGGMGSVFAVFDEKLQREVALKMLTTGEASAQLRERLLREARIIAGLEHPGIIPIHETGTLADNSLYYTMKRVHGRTLRRYLEEQRQSGVLLSIFRKVCEAVNFAHSRNVIHRDLKPDNIMIGDFGEAMVLDWGIAKAGAEEHLPEAPLQLQAAETRGLSATRAGQVMGTPDYMSPEQAAGQSATVDKRSDIFALGKILRDLLSHLARPEKRISSAALRRLSAIADRACESEPDKRYQTVEALLADIDRFEAGEAVEAYRETMVEKLIRWANRHRFMLLLIVVYLIVRYLLFFFSRL